MWTRETWQPHGEAEPSGDRGPRAGVGGTSDANYQMRDLTWPLDFSITSTTARS